ncbi:hypothetical protein ACFLSX_00990 [Calditrichota bacterium]
MKELNRKQIEDLFQKFKVVNSIISQDKYTLDIFFTLSNDQKCLVKYSLSDLKKTYFVDSFN